MLNFGSDFGVITDAWDDTTFRQAVALALSVRRAHTDTPVVLCLDEAMRSRLFCYPSCFSHVLFTPSASGPLRFTNKLHYLLKSPFATTLWLDNDVLVFRRMDRLIKQLGSLPFSMLIHPCDISLPRARSMTLYPAAMHHGRTHVIERGGGGHFLFRRCSAAFDLIDQVLWYSRPAGLAEYNAALGTENEEFSEELAFCLVATMRGIPLPVRDDRELEFRCFLEPPAANLSLSEAGCEFDLCHPRSNTWMSVRPDVVHFCGNGKRNPHYRRYIDRQVAASCRAPVV
jgi:hypothetical protein